MTPDEKRALFDKVFGNASTEAKRLLPGRQGMPSLLPKGEAEAMLDEAREIITRKIYELEGLRSHLVELRRERESLLQENGRLNGVILGMVTTMVKAQPGDRSPHIPDADAVPVIKLCAHCGKDPRG